MRPGSIFAGFLALAALALCGCTKTVVRLEEAFPCPVSASTLSERCAEPQAEADGATYQDVINTAQIDRSNLTKCAAHDQLLANAIAECNKSIAAHNEAIRAINQKFADKP
jgi:hypothetical protein